jgi:hypothetical protein
MEKVRFATFDYYLDESDPDVVILRRQDGSFVAAFSARDVTGEGIVDAAWVHYRGLIQAHTNTLTCLGSRAPNVRAFNRQDAAYSANCPEVEPGEVLRIRYRRSSQNSSSRHLGE